MSFITPIFRRLAGSPLKPGNSGYQVRHFTLVGAPARDLMGAYSIATSERWSVEPSNWRLALEVDREAFCPAFSLRKTSGDALYSEHQSNSWQPETLTFPFKYSDGVTPGLTSGIANALNLPANTSGTLDETLKSLYRLFKDKDVVSIDGSLAVQHDGCDSRLVYHAPRLTVDDAAAKRQGGIFRLRDREAEIREEVEGDKHGLVYVKMDGNIGNIVNGAGLAMATNDAISLNGGSSANFLDAGGQATKETMIQAFGIVLSDPRVRSVLVNIYGGITNGIMIAEAIVGAASAYGLSDGRIPIVVRLQGTNSEQGLKLLEEADLGLHVEADFGEAARKAVELAKTI